MRAFASRVVVVVLVVLAAAAVAGAVLHTPEVFLLAVASILLAVLLCAPARLLAAHTRIGHSWSVLIVTAGAVALLAALGWLLLPEVMDQLRQLVQRLPQALGHLRGELAGYDWLRPLIAQLPDARELVTGENLRRLTGAFTTVFAVLGGLLVFAWLALFLAISPGLYRRGVERLFPPRHRPRVDDVLHQVHDALERWLVAKFLAMLLVAALITPGLWLLDIELALALGILSGLLTFIPNFGPIASAIPPALLGLMNHGPEKALWVVLLYVAVQAAESYAITPMIMKRVAHIPPALLLFAQLLMGTLAGILGLAVAGPLVLAGIEIVRAAYVEDVLEDEGHRAAA